MEKSKFTASDVLEQLFDEDSNLSGSDSDGEEGEDVYTHWGPTLSESGFGNVCQGFMSKCLD